jgi:hypothetical protein
MPGFDVADFDLVGLSAAKRTLDEVTLHRIQRLDEATIDPDDDWIHRAVNSEAELIQSLVVDDHVPFAGVWPFLENNPKILWRVAPAAI